MGGANGGGFSDGVGRAGVAFQEHFARHLKAIPDFLHVQKGHRKRRQGEKPSREKKGTKEEGREKIAKKKTSKWKVVPLITQAGIEGNA